MLVRSHLPKTVEFKFAAQQRGVMQRLTNARFWPGVPSMPIVPRLSASLIAARVLARSAIRATGGCICARRLSFISHNCKHRQRVCVQTLRHRRGTTTAGARNRWRPHGCSIMARSRVHTALTRYFGSRVAALATALL